MRRWLKFDDCGLSGCHANTQAFSRKHNVAVEPCKKMPQRVYDMHIAENPVTFNYRGEEKPEVEYDTDTEDEVQRLTKALKAIGRLHRGKTRDSQKVRAIIRRATR